MTSENKMSGRGQFRRGVMDGLIQHLREHAPNRVQEAEELSSDFDNLTIIALNLIGAVKVLETELRGNQELLTTFSDEALSLIVGLAEKAEKAVVNLHYVDLDVHVSATPIKPEAN